MPTTTVIQGHKHKSKFKKIYVIEIYSSIAGYGVISDVQLHDTPKPVQISPDEADPLKRIRTTKAEIDILLSTAAHVTLMDDISKNPEGTFVLSIDWRNPIDGNRTPIFRGSILNDGIQYPDKLNSIAKIRATDGLELLKKIPLPDDIFIRQKTYLHSVYIHYILNQLSWIPEVIDSTDELWRESIGLKPQQKTTYEYVLNYVGINHYFYSEKQNGFYENESCYDVLEEILTGYNARIYQRNGVYYIDRIADKIGSTQTTWSRYQNEIQVLSSGLVLAFEKVRQLGASTVSDSPIDYTDSVIQQLPYNIIKSVPAVRQVRLTQQGNFDGDLLFGKQWTHDQSSPSYAQLTEVDNSSFGESVVFRFQAAIFGETNTLKADSRNVAGWVEFTAHISVGGKYLRSTGGGANEVFTHPNITDIFTLQTMRVRPTDLQWQTGDTDTGIRFRVPVQANQTGLTQTTKLHLFVIESPAIDTPGLVTVDIRDFTTIDEVSPYSDGDLTLSFNTTFTYATIGDNIVNADDQIESRTLLKTNNLLNSVDITYNMDMADYPNTTTNQRLKRNVNIVEWEDTDLWDRGTDKDTFVNHLINETIELRKIGRKQIDFRIIHQSASIPPHFGQSINYKGLLYICQGYSIDLQNDEYTATYFEIGKEALAGTGPIIEIDHALTLTVGRVANLISDINPVLPELVPDNTPTPAPINDFYNIYASVTGTDITIPDVNLPDPSVYTALSIDRAIALHVGGTKYYYVSSGPSVGEYAIDKANTKIVLGRSLRGQRVSYELTTFKLVNI